MARYQKKFRWQFSPRQAWRNARKRGWRGWLKLAGRGLLYFLFLIALIFIWFSKDLPAVSKIKTIEDAQATQIFDRTGEPLFTVSQDEKRIVLKSDQIPKNVKDATVAIEDANFYHHHGIDFRGVVRALLSDLKGGGASQGGSTITQQLVKNTILDTNKTFSRKAKEAILAIELELISNKDSILTQYLNEIPYGSTAYGIEAASQLYFKKHAMELTLGQAATLAAMPQAPTYYSPYGPNKAELLARKDRILNRMASLDYITSDQADAAKKETIAFEKPSESIVAPHFVFWIKEQLVAKYGEEIVNKGGLKVTTTLDLKVQRMAVSAIDSGAKLLAAEGANNAALVAVDPKTGQILAMVGSKDYFDNSIQGQVNVATAQRQPGSSFKPYVYATAFGLPNYNPAYVLYDFRTDFGGGYVPNNYTGKNYGPVTMRQALANSLNVPAVKTLALVGVDNAIATAQKVGINFQNDPARCGLALVLGCAEVSPLEMASGFSTFANNGQHAAGIGIMKIEDSNGKVLEEYKNPQNNDALDPQQAFLISDVLSDNDARGMVFGTRNYLTVPGHRVAAKTGTTSDFHDAWTVGYTPQISTAVWTGNTDNKAMRSGADGSVVAAPIWQNFMAQYLKDKPNLWIDQPSGVAHQTVDKYSNRLPTDSSPPDQRVTDWFASWSTAAKQKDNVHVKVNVNKLNGKLATDQTPASLVEARYYATVHSEMPNSSNWEGPVLAWAAQNSLNQPPPTEQDDMYASLDKQPVVAIQAPLDGASVSGQVSVIVQASASFTVKQLTLAVDGNTVGQAVNSTNNTFTLDANSLSNGTHKLTATATDGNGATGSASITITYTATPFAISGVMAVPAASSVAINWTTSLSANDQILYGTTAALGSSSVTSSIYSLNHQVTLGGLLPNTTYYFQVKSVTQAGQSALSDIGTFTTKAS